MTNEPANRNGIYRVNRSRLRERRSEDQPNGSGSGSRRRSQSKRRKKDGLASLRSEIEQGRNGSGGRDLEPQYENHGGDHPRSKNGKSNGYGNHENHGRDHPYSKNDQSNGYDYDNSETRDENHHENHSENEDKDPNLEKEHRNDRSEKDRRHRRSRIGNDHHRKNRDFRDRSSRNNREEQSSRNNRDDQSSRNNRDDQNSRNNRDDQSSRNNRDEQSSRNNRNDQSSRNNRSRPGDDISRDRGGGGYERSGGDSRDRPGGSERAGNDHRDSPRDDESLHQGDFRDHRRGGHRDRGGRVRGYDSGNRQNRHYKTPGGGGRNGDVHTGDGIGDQNLRSVNDDPRVGQVIRRAKAGRNTESFLPESTFVRPELRVDFGPNNVREYPRALKHDDVIIVPNFFCDENDMSIYYKLVEEMRHIQADGQRGSEWISWHEGCHLISKNPKGCPTYEMVLRRTMEYFNIRAGSQGTRFNWYRDSSDWKPFHHDSAAFNPQRAKNQNITVGVSFGAPRELAFLHAKNKTRVYFPQRNGCLFSFGRDVNIKYKHAINALPKEEHTGQGRISIVVWGLAQNVIEEDNSPGLLTNDARRGFDNRKQACRDFKKGRCRHGDRCRFSH